MDWLFWGFYLSQWWLSSFIGEQQLDNSRRWRWRVGRVNGQGDYGFRAGNGGLVSRLTALFLKMAHLYAGDGGNAGGGLDGYGPGANNGFQ